MGDALCRSILVRLLGVAIGVGLVALFSGCTATVKVPENCYDKAVRTLQHCMQGVTEAGAVAECTGQMNAAYELCERAKRDAKDGGQ